MHKTVSCFSSRSCKISCFIATSVLVTELRFVAIQLFLPLPLKKNDFPEIIHAHYISPSQHSVPGRGVPAVRQALPSATPAAGAPGLVEVAAVGRGRRGSLHRPEAHRRPPSLHRLRQRLPGGPQDVPQAVSHVAALHQVH